MNENEMMLFEYDTDGKIREIIREYNKLKEKKEKTLKLNVESIKRITKFLGGEFKTIKNIHLIEFKKYNVNILISVSELNKKNLNLGSYVKESMFECMRAFRKNSYKDEAIIEVFRKINYSLLQLEIFTNSKVLNYKNILVISQGNNYLNIINTLNLEKKELNISNVEMKQGKISGVARGRSYDYVDDIIKGWEQKEIYFEHDGLVLETYNKKKNWKYKGYELIRKIKIGKKIILNDLYKITEKQLMNILKYNYQTYNPETKKSTTNYLFEFEKNKLIKKELTKDIEFNKNKILYTRLNYYQKGKEIYNYFYIDTINKKGYLFNSDAQVLIKELDYSDLNFDKFNLYGSLDFLILPSQNIFYIYNESGKYIINLFNLKRYDLHKKYKLDLNYQLGEQIENIVKEDLLHKIKNKNKEEK